METAVLFFQVINVLLKQDILLINIGEDHVNLSRITRSPSTQHGLGNLQHGSNAGAASNHTKATDHVGRVDHSTLGAAHFHLIANFERREVARNVSGGVALDEQVEVAWVDIGGDGRVGADDLFASSGAGFWVSDIELGCQGNVLADG